MPNLDVIRLQASRRSWVSIGGSDPNTPMALKLIEPRFSEVDDDQMRFEKWQQLTSSLFVASKKSPMVGSRDLSFRCYNLDRLLFFDHSAGAYGAERTPSQIVTQGVDHILLGLQTVGTTLLMRSDGVAMAGVGDLVVLDLSQRFQFATEGMSAIHICLPRRRFENHARKMGARHMQILRSEGEPLLKLMADHLLNMRTCLHHAVAEQLHLLTSAAIAICNAAFTPPEDSSYNEPAVAAIEVRQFIEENIQHQDLGIELLCARFGLSRTPLYKLFEVDGGIVSYIRSRRLARAMLMLSGVEGRSHQRVSSVAYACGYQSAKMFSRAFHRRYGVNPREVNRTYQTVAIQEKGALLASWIQNL